MRRIQFFKDGQEVPSDLERIDTHFANTKRMSTTYAGEENTELWFTGYFRGRKFWFPLKLYFNADGMFVRSSNPFRTWWALRGMR